MQERFYELAERIGDAVILRSRRRRRISLCHKNTQIEILPVVYLTGRARFFAALRMTANGLRMTAFRLFFAARFARRVAA
jgi:hypothetical protein